MPLICTSFRRGSFTHIMEPKPPQNSDYFDLFFTRFSWSIRYFPAPPPRNSSHCNWDSPMIFYRGTPLKETEAKYRSADRMEGAGSRCLCP